MLTHIIPSKTRRKILALFFQNLETPYYLRRVVREVDEEVNAVKRELDILEGEKVLIRERRLNKVFYSINKHYALYDEFLRIFTKMGSLATAVYKNLPKLGKVKFIALSTKFAKKQVIGEDEVYMLIVGIVVVPEIASIVTGVEAEFGREINYTAMADEEFVFRKRNNDPFIWRFLRQPKVMLVGSEDDLLK